MNETKETLLRRIKAEYEAYQKELLTKTPQELVDMADEIVAAKTVYPFFSNSLDDKVVKILSQFAEPLSVVRDEWLSEFCWASDTEMSHVFWNIQDKAADFCNSYELVGDAGSEKETGLKQVTKDNLRARPPCPLIGANGNIYNLLGIASATLRENGMDKEAAEMMQRVTGGGCHSYEQALCIISEYVEPTDILSEHPTKSTNHKKKENAYER